MKKPVVKAPDSKDVGRSNDLWNSIRRLRILCIGNGGIIYRDGRFWTHRCIGQFLGELGELVSEVCFCAWTDPSDDPLAQTALSDMRGVRALGLPSFHGSPLRKMVNGLRSFSMLIRQVWQSDFVYLYWPGRLSSIAARLCRALNKPYGIYFRGEQIPFDSTFATSFQKAHFTLTAGDLLRTAAEEYCKDVENVTPMTSVRPDHIVRARPPKQEGPWNLLYVGRLEERKGVQDLLAAMTHLEKWDLQCNLTMVGHCYDPSGLMGQLSPSIARRVRWIDAVAEFESLIPFYCAADVFVFPSHDEGFPRVLYEAMTFGVPILTTFVGSIPSLMKDRSNCLRIIVRDPRDIAEKIRHLLHNPELQAKLSSSSHQCITDLMEAWQRSHAIQIAERLRDLVSRTT